MSAKLPVVIVDDKLDLFTTTRRRLEKRGYVVEMFDDLDEAARVLHARPDPFVLVLDHDFDRPDGRTGFVLADLLRASHPYGSLLPICYYSGRVSGETFLAEQRMRQHSAPTSYTFKDSDVSIVDVIEEAAGSFHVAIEAAERQSFARALVEHEDEVVGDDLEPSQQPPGQGT